VQQMQQMQRGFLKKALFTILVNVLFNAILVNVLFNAILVNVLFIDIMETPKSLLI